MSFNGNLIEKSKIYLSETRKKPLLESIEICQLLSHHSTPRQGASAGSHAFKTSVPFLHSPTW